MSFRGVMTPDDLRKGDLAPVGWHPVEIIEYKEGEASEDAKNPGSATFTFVFKILDGPGKGIECRKLYSEVALGFMKDLLITLGVAKKDQTANIELSSELFESFVGKKLMLYNKHGESNRGNKFNDVTSFKPLEAVTA